MNGTVYEENQLRERVLNLIHSEGISERQFAIQIGRQANNVYSILVGERHFPRGFCGDILKAFPKVNKEWLVFGEGTMYGDEDTTKTIAQMETRPRLPKTFSGGHLEDYYKGDKRDQCQEKPINPLYPDYDFTLIIKNNRMTPKYERGDELAFKKATLIEWGNDYLIDTPEGLKFKKILDDGNSVRCISYNKEEYPEFSIPKNMILGYYRIVGLTRVY